MYRVVAEFYDLTDRNHRYLPGDQFPREGLTVAPARLEMLASDRNKCGKAVIAEEAAQDAKPIKKTARKRVSKGAN